MPVLPPPDRCRLAAVAQAIGGNLPDPGWARIRSLPFVNHPGILCEITTLVAIMRAFVGIALGGLLMTTGCNPPPHAPAPIAQPVITPTEAFRAQQEARQKDTEARIAKEQAQAAERGRIAGKEWEAKVRLRDEQGAVIMPAYRACIARNAQRLALASKETADLVAIAVMGGCRSYEAQIDRAFQITGDMEGATGREIHRLLVPWAIELVVNARAAPQTPQRADPPAVPH